MGLRGRRRAAHGADEEQWKRPSGRVKRGTVSTSGHPTRRAMNSAIDEFLDDVDQWKLNLHKKLKRMTPAQRIAFWTQIHDEARARELPVVEPENPMNRSTKRVRRSGS